MAEHRGIEEDAMIIRAPKGYTKIRFKDKWEVWRTGYMSQTICCGDTKEEALRKAQFEWQRYLGGNRHSTEYADQEGI